MRRAANLLMLLASAALAACAPDDPLAPRPGAHLVLISLDTLRADHLGCYGYERDTTPVIDAFAQHGVLFEDVLAAASTTAPSHMTMFTGVLPRVHGIHNNVSVQQSPRLRLLAEILADHGYRTAAFADGGLIRDTNGFDRGFQHFDSRFEFFDQKLDRVEGWLEQAPDEPTFLFVHTYGVHAPYVPTRAHDLFSDPDYSGRLAGRDYVLELRMREGGATDLALLMNAFWEQQKLFDDADVQHLIDLYDGAIHRVDADLERLFEALDDKGWMDDAWVVITSDHGEAFREHGGFQHRSVHQEELAVPLILRPPGGLPEGLRVPSAVSHVDLQPTLLSLLDLPPEPATQGRAWVPLDAPRERPRFASGGERARFDVVVEQRRKLIHANDPKDPADVLRGLYDLDVDPGEQHDLSDVLPAPPWRARLERRLAEALDAAAALRASIGDPEAGPGLTAEQRAELAALGYTK